MSVSTARNSSGEALVRMTEATAYREGFGNEIAEGSKRMGEKFNHPEVFMGSKGQEFPAYDPRGFQGMGVAYATCNRGACHLRGYTPASELLGIPIKTDPLEWKGKGELLKIFQDLHAFSDSLDLCKFSAFAEGADEYAAQYEAIVGETLNARVIVPANWLSWLKKDDVVNLSVSETGTSVSGHVVRIGAAVDPVSHTIPIWARLDKTADLRPGMTARAEFPGAPNNAGSPKQQPGTAKPAPRRLDGLAGNERASWLRGPASIPIVCRPCSTSSTVPVARPI